MKSLLFWLLNAFILLLLMTVNRFVLLFRFCPDEVWKLYKFDIIPAFQRGFRFDLKVTGFLLLPLVIWVLASFFFDPSKMLRGLKKSAKVLWPLFVLILLIDQQYYAFFQSHINILFFGVAEDDTQAVLKSVWTDHPFIRVMLFWASLVYLIYKILDLSLPLIENLSLNEKFKRYFQRKEFLIAFLIFAPAYVMAMRGSFTIFPLMRDDANISNHPYVNYLVMNPFFSLKEAIQERKETTKLEPESTLLGNSGFQSEGDALNTLDIKSMSELFKSSNENPEARSAPLNVVHSMMESWSNSYIDYHDKENNDLLGSLEGHFKEDFLFRNFFSSTSSTLPSFEAMIFSKENPLMIWNSPFRFSRFESSIARPFADKGYRTVFITSGKLGWRNLNQWIKKQYFEEAYGQDDIARRYSDAQICSWGVYDEYALRLAHDLLKEADSRPVFIFIQTTSNHTPYEIPSHYVPRPTHIPEALSKNMASTRELVERSLVGYQYANNALGTFISSVKNDAQLSNNTIISATGDHSAWTLIPRNSTVVPLKLQLSVPFYVRVPDRLRKQLYFDKDRAGSHKDLQATLVNLALDNTRYFAMGNNLFAPKNSKTEFYGFNAHGNVIASNISEELAQKKRAAYQAINQIYFQRSFCANEPKWCEKETK